MMEHNSAQNTLTNNVFIPENIKDGLGIYENAFAKVKDTDNIVDKIKSAIRNKDLPKQGLHQLIGQAKEQEIITADEAAKLSEAMAIAADAVMVDSFEIAQYLKHGQDKTSS